MKRSVTHSFLQSFVSEQIEQEIFLKLCKKFDLIGRDKLAQYQNYKSLTCIRSKVMTMGNDGQTSTAS